jgi:hypothetical protein
MLRKGRLSYIAIISLIEIFADNMATFFTLKAIVALKNERESATPVTLDKG